MSEIPLDKTPTLEDLKPSRGIYQAGYKDIKKSAFNGSLIDYFCLVSTDWIAMLVNGFHETNKDKDLPLIESLRSAIIVSESDFKNMIRLFLKRPEIFFTLVQEYFNFKKDDFLMENLYIKEEVIKFISSYWFRYVYQLNESNLGDLYWDYSMKRRGYSLKPKKSKK